MKWYKEILLFINSLLRKKHSKLVISVLILGFLLFIFFPGFMSGDSINQYIQATKRSGFEDWHPPIMAILWRLTTVLSGSWKSFVILQLSTLVAACYLFSKEAEKISSKFWLPWLFIFLPLFPYILSISGVLWKDVIMAYFVLFICALLMQKPKKSLYNLMFFSLAILFAASFRHNSLVIILPVAIYLSLYFLDRLRIRLVYLLCFLLVTAATPTVINKIFNVHERHVEMAVMIDDIQNLTTSNSSTRSNLPPYIQRYLEQVDADCDYLGYKTDSLFECGSINTYVDITEKDFGTVKKFWIETIKSNPISYIKYRIIIFSRFIRPANNNYVWQNGTDPNPYGAVARYGNFQQNIKNIVTGFENDISILFKPYFWIILSSLCIIFGVTRWKKESNKHVLGISLLLSSTSLLYILTFFPVVIVSDFRMTYIATLLTTISALLLITNNTKKQRKHR